MKSLKITLALAALLAVFFITVSGQSSDNTQIDSNQIEKANYDLLATNKKKGAKPSNA